MSQERPKVAPQLVAAIIEGTPDRVRRRLDSSPDAAAAWDWQASDVAWAVNTGGETVTLPLAPILSVDQVRCTCLLSPRCFHVLACLTRLEVSLLEAEHEAPAGDEEEVGDDVVEPEETQRGTVRDLMNKAAQLLRVGVANAGVVVQSGLLRAVHQCRAEGLHRLASLGLRVTAGISEFRSRASASDPAQLAEDLAELLETGRQLLSPRAVASFWIGTARRKQLPVRPRKLHGLFAEPILTRSGFAGAAVYFLGEDDQIYTASDVRPGDAQHARDAYLGGIEIGSMIQPAKQLARGLYLGTDLTASQDGRLGRGKNIKIVEQGPSTWQVAAIQDRFRRPLLDQWNAVYAQANLPADARPAGWDFVFVAGRVVGAAGPELVFARNDEPPLRLAIENESETLFFRENLRMLSHAPGLRLQIIARMNLQDPRMVAPLALVPGDAPTADEPHLEIPKTLGGRVSLGFEEIQGKHLLRARSAPVVLGVAHEQAENNSPLGALRRRWIAAMLAGIAGQRPGSTSTLAAESTLLNRNGFATGAALLDALGRSHSEGDAIDTFLATAIYLRQCGHELARSRASLGMTI